MNLKTRLTAREYVFLGLLVLVPVGMWRFVFVPRAQSMRALSAGMEEKKDQLQVLTWAREVSMERLQQDKALLSKALKTMGHRLPRKDDLDGVVENLSVRAKANGLRMKNIQSVASRVAPKVGDKEEEKPPKYVTRQESMEVDGDFLAFYSFLQSLEDLDKIVHVDKMRMVKDQKGDKQGHVSVSLTLMLYYRPPETGSETADG